MSQHPDAKRSRLRTMIGAMDEAMAGSDANVLAIAWSDLVKALDLGPEPATRICPHCGAIGMRQASRCGHCWHALADAGAGT